MRFSKAWFGSVRFHISLKSLASYGMVWYGMVWYYVENVDSIIWQNADVIICQKVGAIIWKNAGNIMIS